MAYVVIWREPGYDRERRSMPYPRHQQAQRRFDKERRDHRLEQRKRLRIEQAPGWVYVRDLFALVAVLISVAALLGGVILLAWFTLAQL